MSPAEELLNEIAYSYRSWTQYDDQGVVEYLRPDTGGTTRLDFATQFRTPATFRCRFHHHGSDSDFELTRDGDGAVVRRGDHTEHYDSFATATAALTGVSMGVVSTIPRLLMWRDLDSWTVTQLEEPAILAPTEVDGHLCQRVQGVHPWQPLQLELIVDDRIRVVRRIIESMMAEGTTVKIFTSYFPTVVV